MEVENLWYGSKDKLKVTSRCKNPPASDPIKRSSKFICLYFARGECINRECQFNHRIPNSSDNFELTVDCFGREKFIDYKDDMSGVGSIERINKTLYIGSINNIENAEILIGQVFGEYGDVESIKVFKNKRMAFVKYHLESQAQFAKEAMNSKSLLDGDTNERLIVKWAMEDPNAKTQKQNEINLELQAKEAAKNLLNKLKIEQKVHEETKLQTYEEPAINQIKLLPLIDESTIQAFKLKNKGPDHLDLLNGYESD